MWCQYTVIIAVFHFLEFFMTAVYQPVSLSYDCTAPPPRVMLFTLLTPMIVCVV